MTSTAVKQRYSRLNRFVEWAQNEIAVVPDFHKRILFSDGAFFWLNGYVNKQNCRIWSKANPPVYVETPLHPEKLTVWCALWAGGIIGPYFFKNDEGHNVTVNGDRYRTMITNFFIPEFNNHDVQELWFQQDGTTCHTARATIDLLKDTFGDRLISRFGPVQNRARFCSNSSFCKLQATKDQEQKPLTTVPNRSSSCLRRQRRALWIRKGRDQKILHPSSTQGHHGSSFPLSPKACRTSGETEIGY
ncbi:putative DD41D transposase [Trichonephila clavipes]|nr:putative DD41D transposase [Trichonephila clavipes]